MKSAIGSTDYTGQYALDYEDTAQYGDTTTYTNVWQINNKSTDGASGQTDYTWQNNDWTKWHGYYRKIPELAAIIDKKAQWVVGKGFKLKGSAETKNRIRRIKGYGKDTFNSIMANLVRTYTIAGDAFAEIIRDKKGRLINLKPLAPDSIKIVVNPQGMIKEYIQTANLPHQKEKTITRFDKDDILHLAWNRIADEIHGISTIEKLELTIQMMQEIKRDMRVIFHRYVKPLLITEVDTDDATEIASFKTQLDKAVEKGENLIIPKGTANVDRVSIPQYSTLDPLPWVRYLEKEFIRAEGIPQVILGSSSEEDTEASAKIVYLAFEQMVRYNQLFLEDQLKAQMNLDINFEFPASIEPSLLEDNKKDGQINKAMNVNPTKHE